MKKNEERQHDICSMSETKDSGFRFILQRGDQIWKSESRSHASYMISNIIYATSSLYATDINKPVEEKECNEVKKLHFIAFVI